MRRLGMKNFLQNATDFFIGYSMLKTSHLSYYDTTSWYVTSLCDALDKYSNTHHMADIATCANNELKNDAIYSDFISTLKKLCFLRGQNNFSNNLLNNSSKDKEDSFYYENGKYIGSKLNRLRHGKGVFYYLNGDKYEGDWENDRNHGKGVFYLKGRGSYIGDWLEDKRHGRGVFIRN